jgi:hypothetical protein
MAETAFAKAFANKAKGIFNKAKGHKHRTGQSFGPADVPDGNYSAVIGIAATVPKKGKMEGTPVVRVTGTITTGPHEGKEPSQTFFCEGKQPSDDKDAMPTAEQQLLGLLEWLLPDCEISDISQVEAAIDEVNGRMPLVIINVRNTKSKTNGKTYQNVYFNKMVKERTLEQTEAPNDDAVPVASQEKEEVQSDEPTLVAPVKGDVVLIEDLEGEYEVTRVYQSRQTIDAVSKADGSKATGIGWSQIEIV